MTVQRQASNAAADLIGVPLDFGVHELGLKIGPDAFRQAKIVQVLQSVGVDARDCGNIPVDAVEDVIESLPHVLSIRNCCLRVADRVAESIRSGRVPVCLGGDHSLAIGSVAGAVRALGDIGCIWIDAHPDANTPDTSPTGNVHGMPVAVLLGHGAPELTSLEPAGAKIAYDKTILIGCRDIDPSERAFLAEHDVQMFEVFDMVRVGLTNIIDQSIGRLGDDVRGVHVSIDLDSLSEAIAPGVGLPSNCGFDMREISFICQELARRLPICSIDVVGLNPVRDIRHKTAHTAIELISILQGHHMSCSYYNYLKRELE